MDSLRAQVTVYGTVQGVAFRASTRNEASRLGVGGWVRNLPDGTVEALFEGEKESVERIVTWCRQGPPGARVTNMEIVWEAYQGEFQSFEIRYGIH